ncbi:conserved hypothetical protein [Trichinella spiralis]|uniref:hypothetical protein n=1 Tax=Trichinella spiralis TaxID=6334 RepID=UPI0001EFDAFC|nr:conserved hypothetical protein [Trichinella spiralis]
MNSVPEGERTAFTSPSWAISIFNCWRIMSYRRIQPRCCQSRWKLWSDRSSSTADGMLVDSVQSFVAELKRLSLNCAFPTHLSSALPDQFIFGLPSDAMKRRLLVPSELAFEKNNSIHPTNGNR